MSRLTVESELALRDPLQQLPGLVNYYAGIDGELGAVTNVSVWDTLEHARAMDEFVPMLAFRPSMEDVGVVFESITDHEGLCSIIGATPRGP